MGKNIIICCDGTNNEVAGNQSNILRLFRTLAHHDAQDCFYDAGVGTKADPTALWPLRRFVRKHVDAGVGESIRDNVLEAYRFLAGKYEIDDRVFLFGFSRGAYTVRALAAFVNRCGLLRSEHLHLAEYAWSIFADEDHSEDKSRRFGGTARIKKVFAVPAAIHFVGVWDTVSSVGWFWDLLTLPDTARNPGITHFRHAMAIDETRGLFRLNLFHPGSAQDCRQVWFAGVHADVGGGYPEDEAGLARISLRWMLAEARACGLIVDGAAEQAVLDRMGNQAPDHAAPMHNESKKCLWQALAWLPRRAYSETAGGRRWQWPNVAKRRILGKAPLVHCSVELRMMETQLKYRPNLPTTCEFVGDLPLKQSTPT